VVEGDNAERLLNQQGTIDYMAPEIFERSEPCYDGKASDVFALGIVLFMIITG
jgi:serine/threonine protein kinase